MECTLAVVKKLIAGELSANMWVVFWSKLYDMRDDFDATVTQKAMLSCAGARLILGGDNPWSNAMYYQCASMAMLSGDMYSFIMSIFVDVPMAKCVCLDSAGQDISTFVSTSCAKNMPISLIPTLFAISNQVSGMSRIERQSLACSSVVDFVKNKVKTSMDRWINNQIKSVECLSDAVDYLMTKFDSGAGNCQDFEHDPHVVVVVPWPSDYFQQCGKTSLCKEICMTEWKQFSAVKASAETTTETLSFAMESMFFPGAVDDSLKLTNATASLQVDPAFIGCTVRSAVVPQDYALLVAEQFAYHVTVQGWCFPRQASARPYRATAADYSASLPGDVISARFGKAGWLAVLLIHGDQFGIVVASKAGGLVVLPDVPTPAGYDLVSISNMWVVEDAIIADVVTRHWVDDRSTSTMLSSMMVYGANATWGGTGVNLVQFGSNMYDYARYSSGYLFYPLFYGFPAFQITFYRTGSMLTELSRTMMSTQVPLPSVRFSSYSLSDSYVFATSPNGWSWLKQVRFDKAGSQTGLYESAPVDMTLTVSGRCDEISCEGCKDVAVQRFCLAYNRCALSQCVGTTVNQRRPLCGLGGVMRSYGVRHLMSTLAAWRVIAEMMTQILDLSFKGLKSVNLDFINDAFLVDICTAKDSGVQLVSVITSFINAVLQLSHANAGYMYQAGANVDKNSDSVLTITTTAMTSFISQIFLYDLYFTATIYQIVMCELVGTVALIDSSGTNIVVMTATSTDDMSGVCLSVGTDIMTRYVMDSSSSVTYAMASMMANVETWFTMSAFEPVIHVIDGVIAYAVGIVHSLAVLLMSQYAAKCNPPDFYLNTTVNCACNNQRLWVPEPQRSDSAFWCTGILSMLDANNKQKYVYNPYSLKEIQALSSGLRSYVECASTSYSCDMDNPAIFYQQGVSVFNVLVKCRDNYVKRKWDPASYMLTDMKYRQKISLPDSFDVPVYQGDACGVANCLSRVESGTTSVETCMNLYIACTGGSYENYFAYERSPLAGPEYTDACLVFSGPAQIPLTDFLNCMDGPDTGLCKLPQHCWSPKSANNVPVCEQHRLLSHGINPDGVVQRLFSDARSLVVGAVNAAIASEAKVDVDFFSVEGDVLHQTMDCIFMGPYSRVNYWPMPYCSTGEECLDGPYWSRDASGGASRNNDPNDCGADATLPYTCGSEARRAIMRYLVRDNLKGSSGQNMKQILNITLHEILSDWSDASAYACTNCTGYLPTNLSKPFIALKSDTVMQALSDDFERVFRQSLEIIAPWKMESTMGFDWSKSQRAQDEARFNPLQPVRQYDKSEASTPLQGNTLWYVCHAALKQTFFTLPVDAADNIVGAMAYDGNTSRLEEFITAYTQRAMLRSPLYWHYQPRHAPSNSTFYNAERHSTAGAASAGFSDFTMKQTKLADGASFPTFPVYPLGAFAVGAPRCLCGWERSGDTCIPPNKGMMATVCSLVPCDSVGYRASDDAKLLGLLHPDWACPESDVSAHWGMLDPAAQEAWMQGRVQASSSDDLLRYGRAGLKAGSFEATRTAARAQLNPSKRQVPLYTADIKGASRLPEDLTQDFLDELFPANQGVQESGAVAYCLRYLVELARATVLSQSPGAQETMKTWRRRCGSQLQMISLCASLDVFKPRTVDSKQQCPHFAPINDASAGVYSTPECLVNVRGTFYDPCRCMQCSGDKTVKLDVTKMCGLRLDPRTFIRQAPIGWWSAENQVNDWLLDPSSLLDEGALTEILTSDPQSTGNVAQGSDWWSAEGLMAGNSDMCDMVHDWWPEDWEFPVGYHVTVPCDASDAAYRSFVQAFGVDDRGDMVYVHDALRDYAGVDTLSGYGGVCRTSNYGMPIMESNLMRFCTSVASNTEDVAISRPAGNPTVWSTPMCTQESTDLPWDAYVPGGSFQTSKVSLGTVPNMPPPSSTTYPESEASTWPVGITSGGWGHACSDFDLYTCASDAGCPAGYSCRGRMCSGGSTVSCTIDTQCSGGSTCQGVCMSVKSVDCIQHADCAPGLMCTGVGRCVTPTVAVYSTLDSDNISVQLSTAGKCPAGSRSFSLSGASYWAYPGNDFMKMHGMCTYEDWYKYGLTVSRCGVVSDSTVTINPRQCPFWSLDKAQPNTSTWWPKGNSKPDVFFLRPTNCDRDYERLQGFTLCAPETGASMLQVAGQTGMIGYDVYTSLHTRDGLVRLAKMPGYTDKDYGFLGVPVNSLSAILPDGDNPFVMCSTLAQCYASPFTVRGVRSKRSVPPKPGSSVRQPYDENTVFRCGSFGLRSGDNCVLDMDVLPLYRALCSQLPITECVAVVPDALRLCSSVLPTYQATNAERQSNLDALVALFYGFSDFNNIFEYGQLQTCMVKMYADITTRAAQYPGNLSTGLYYPLMYSLYEVSFDWFYQCVIMARARVTPGARRSQDCPAYSHRGQYTTTSYTPVSPTGSDDPMTYLRFLRAGYTVSGMAAYEAHYRNLANAQIDAAVTSFLNAVYGGQDRSAPRCFRNLKWKIGPYGYDYEVGKIIFGSVSSGMAYNAGARALIWNWYSMSTCMSAWQSELIDDVDASLGITAQNWLSMLTTPDTSDMVYQGPHSTTVVGIVRKFMMANVNIAVVNSVQKDSKGCVTFDADIPSVFQGTIPPELYPEPQATAAQEVRADDPSEPQVCVFRQADDPLQATGTDCNQPDNGLRTCLVNQQRVACSSVPVYYSRNGMYNCMYESSSGIPPAGCTESNPSCVVDTIVPGVLQNILSRYTPPAGIMNMPPEQLPWFTGNDWFTGFDLTPVLNYQQNIQPNPDRAVTCEINTVEDAAVKFSTCNSPHYEALKSHVNANYKHNGNVLVPPLSQLEWRVSRETLTAGVILAYSSTNRSLGQRYIDFLLDDDSVCGEASIYHMCWKSASDKVASINPWMLGQFNPFSACDVEFLPVRQGSSEYIYAYCNEENQECPAYNARAVPTRCSPLFRQFVTYSGVPSTVDNTEIEYNLCGHTLQEDDDGCMNDQGLLGGYDGLPVAAPSTSDNMLAGTQYASSQYTVAQDMYTNSTWAIPDDFRSGIYGSNPLWSGKDAPYGHLQPQDTDIGGHRLGFMVNRSVERGISTMFLWRMPMTDKEDGKFMLKQTDGLPVSDWVPNLIPDMRAEHAANWPIYGTLVQPSAMAPTCPLLRWAFYSGSAQSFSPVLPLPKRAMHLFKRIHGGSMLAHPTMKGAPGTQHIGVYTTHNGFCACPQVTSIKQSHCLTEITSSALCSLSDTVSSLRAASWRQSFVFKPINNMHTARQCSMHFDWPDVGNTMRDGSTPDSDWSQASDVTDKRCHLLDRLTPFQYMYKPASSMNSKGGNTISAGVCKMGRVASLGSWRAPPSSTRCVRVGITDTAVTTTCQDTFTRKQRLPTSDAAARIKSRRSKCSQCAGQPRFKTPAGSPIQAESSFGMLYRLSAERMVANGLRSALCPDGNCNGVLNATSWRKGAFMRNLLKHPDWLVMPDANVNARPPAPAPPPDDSDLWVAKPWVYCPSREAMMNGTGCDGVISRDVWLQARATVCPDMIRRLSVSNGTTRDPMSRTPFCNIDSSTSAVCQAITEARQLVEQANCILAGRSECMPSPFVYHPATYEPSNDAWVHDTVASFYTRYNAKACPAAAGEGQALIDYNRRYQQSCPANTLNVVEGLLNILRVLSTNIVLIVMTFISMDLKILSLIMPVNVLTQMKFIMEDWAFIKTKGKDMLHVVSDIAVDMALNSGSLGPAIVWFLRVVCTSINNAVRWVLRVWCDYVSYYMVKMLDTLRQFIGMSGSAFEVLNDFMDEMLQGILPVSFFAKYGTKEFQKIMANKYSEPTSHTDTVKSKTKVPVKVDAKPRSRVSRIRYSATNAITKMTGSSFLKAAGLLGGIATAGLAAIEIANAIEGMRLYPDNFTLFDTSDVINVLDDFAKFIFSDGTCDAYRAAQDNGGYVLFSCLVLDMDKYTNTTAGTTSIDSTLCWADATPTLGQSSLFSCNPTSTCCRTEACTEFVMCQLCPDNTLAGVSKFGCDTYRRRCACGHVHTSFDTCSANRQCRSDSQCMLVSSMDNKQYGSIPCGMCPGQGQVFCVLPTTGFPGQCSCVMDVGTGFDTCAGPAGTVTVADASKLCLYMHGYSASSNSWRFELDDLMVMSCVQAKKVVCSSVDFTGKGWMLLAVSYQTSNSRRLLSLEEEEEVESVLRSDWTHPYCAQVVAMAVDGRRLGASDRQLLDSCVYWRRVGRKLVAKYNFTKVSESVLVSYDDFTSMVASDGIFEVLQTWFLLDAAMYHPMLSPLKAFGAHVASQLDLGIQTWHVLYGDEFNIDPFDDHVEPPSVIVMNSTQWRAVPHNDTSIIASWHPPRPQPDAKFARGATPGASGRRLMTIQDDAAAVKAYSAQVIEGVTPILKTSGTTLWSTGVFQWPPLYDYSLSACPVAEATIHVGHQVLKANKLYYDNFHNTNPRNISRSFSANLPVVNWTLPKVKDKSGTWAGAAYVWVLHLFGITPAHVVAFFTTRQDWTLSWIVETYVECDLPSVLTCSKHTKDLASSLVMIALTYLVVRVFSSGLGFPVVANIYLYSTPLIVLWYTYGVAPTCLPMIPPCVLGDVILFVQDVLPTEATFPKNLTRSCAENATGGVNGTCLRSCADLGYTSWEEPLVFALCDYGACEWLRPYLPDTVGRMQRVIAEDSGVDANRMCTWVTFIYALPVLASAASVLTIAGAVLIGVTTLFQPIFMTVASLYIYVWT